MKSFIRKLLSRVSRRLRHSNSSLAKIVAQNPSENEPGRAKRAANRPADLRFSNARVVAHRNLYNPEPLQRAFQNNFHRPSVSRLFERKRTQNIRACRAERAEVRDPLLKQKRDQSRSKPVAKCGVPGKSTGNARPCQT